jgi:hypothetical protein
VQCRFNNYQFNNDSAEQMIPNQNQLFLPIICGQPNSFLITSLKSFDDVASFTILT